MYKIDIISNNQITNSGKFESEVECMSWYNANLMSFALDHTYQISSITSEIESNLALEYLKQTDWYIIREYDSGVQCPPEIKAARAAARLKVL